MDWFRRFQLGLPAREEDISATQSSSPELRDEDELESAGIEVDYPVAVLAPNGHVLTVLRSAQSDGHVAKSAHPA